MRRRITHVDPMSASRVLALLFFVHGVIVGVLALAMKVAGLDIVVPFAALPGATTVTLLLWTPLSFAALGLISGGILAGIYNWVAKRFGGIEYEMEKSV
jgi:hypothetical protein